MSVLTDLLELRPNEIEDGLRDGRFTVSLIGLGRAGLTFAVILARTGAHVIGVDVDKAKVDALRAGLLTIYEPGLDRAFKSVIGTKLEISADLGQAVSHACVIVICVGTPSNKAGRLRLTQLRDSCVTIGENLQRGALVILRSTVCPGTTRMLVKRVIEERTGMKAGVDFGLVYCPERFAGGRAMDEVISVPHILAGFGEKSVRSAQAFFHLIGGEVITSESVEVAEMAKLFDNVYRHVNIALANELGLICEALNIDMLEVLKLCNSGPRTNIMLPGAGVGGSCLSKDPQAVATLANESGLTPRLIVAAIDTNERILEHAVDLVISAYKQLGRPLAGSKIAVFGLAYKGDTGDLRATAAKPIIKMLRKRKASVHAYDPFVQAQNAKKTFGRIRITTDPLQAAEDADCILVMAKHSTLKSISPLRLAQVARKPAAFVDAVQAFEREEVLRSGFVYRGVGRGTASVPTTLLE